jgi:apolipoprotein N-acyltransferase
MMFVSHVPFLNNLPQKWWLRLLILISLGLCVVAALPPFHILPLAFIGLAGLFLFLEKAGSKKQAFLCGWFFGFGFFGGGLYWLTNAFFVHSDKHGWLVPIAVPALALSMGVFIGLTTLLAFILYQKQRKPEQVYIRIALFAVAWCVMEALRGVLFTGFPWNLIGTIWGISDAMMQPAAFLGAYGLSLLTVLILLLPVSFLYVLKEKRIWVLGICVAVPALIYGLGHARLSMAKVDYHDGVLLRLVQPNISQATKWDRMLQIDHFQKHLDLSQHKNSDDPKPTHIIWPETAATFPLNREAGARLAISSVVPKGGYVITGTPLMTPRGTSPYQVWNSLVAIDEQGQIAGRYDKSHLVPFGEYIPLRKYNPVPKLTAGSVDFSAGAGLETIALDGLPAFSPLICYEIIFPGAVNHPENPAKWILNITNDGWYGDSPGPYQHLISARMRAVEEGVPLVRVANTGISVLTDPYGRILGKIGYGEIAYLDVELPKEIEGQTVAKKFGDYLWAWLCLIVILAQKYIRFRKNIRTPQS